MAACFPRCAAKADVADAVLNVRGGVPHAESVLVVSRSPWHLLTVQQLLQDGQAMGYPSRPQSTDQMQGLLSVLPR